MKDLPEVKGITDVIQSPLTSSGINAAQSYKAQADKSVYSDYQNSKTYQKETVDVEFQNRIRNGKKSALVSYLADPQIEGWRDQAYVPKSSTNKSGVTIGNGVDMGQYSASDFAKMGIAAPLIDRIESYGLFGKKGSDAELQLKQMQREYGGAAFSKDEVTYLSNAVVEFQQGKMRSEMPAGRWDSMTPDQQTVTMSLYHLYGNSFYSQNNVKNGKLKEGALAPRGHAGFNQAIAGDWMGLYENLQNYGQPMHDKRNRYVAETLKGSVYQQQVQILTSMPQDQQNEMASL